MGSEKLNAALNLAGLGYLHKASSFGWCDVLYWESGIDEGS